MLMSLVAQTGSLVLASRAAAAAAPAVKAAALSGGRSGYCGVSGRSPDKPRGSGGGNSKDSSLHQFLAKLQYYFFPSISDPDAAK